MFVDIYRTISESWLGSIYVLQVTLYNQNRTEIEQ